jgi:hypothetical protein
VEEKTRPSQVREKPASALDYYDEPAWRRWWTRTGRGKRSFLVSVFVLIFLLTASSYYAEYGEFSGVLLPAITASVWTLTALAVWNLAAWIVHKARKS